MTRTTAENANWRQILKAFQEVLGSARIKNALRRRGDAVKATYELQVQAEEVLWSKEAGDLEGLVNFIEGLEESVADGLIISLVTPQRKRRAARTSTVSGGRVTVQLETEMVEAIDKHATKLNITRSAAIRLLLRQSLHAPVSNEPAASVSAVLAALGLKAGDIIQVKREGENVGALVGAIH